MKILFEGYQYKYDLIANILNRQFYSAANNSDYSVVDYVGYYYNSEIKEAIIILPKVFVYNNGLAFGKYSPINILLQNKDFKQELKEDKCDVLLFNISTWLYRAIVQYKKRVTETTSVETENINSVISSIGVSENTELDIVLSLIRFFKDNQSLFICISKINHSGDKILWNKTVSKNIVYINNNIPFYPKIITKKKSIDFDEDLIIIYYSVLQYLKEHYGFNFTINQNYKLIKGNEFDRLLRNGTRKLKSIKTKYFSDRLVSLWKLLYVFFERSETNKKSNTKYEEVLLIKNFNNVFEDMINDLVGDKNDQIPRYFIDQLDGKRVDHLFRYKSLIKNDDIYFVGDSKYYKPESVIEKNSIEKQYTYARNIIQYNINLFNNNGLKEGIRYRDELTEGYNITPNFFISALIDPDFDFLKDGLINDDSFKCPDIQYQFADRLFDRDTLLIQRYNINFLFVLSAYVSKNNSLKSSFKEKARKNFRDRMIKFFNENYIFYVVTPINIKIDDFITKYFRLLNGKMYRPSSMESSLIVAFAKGFDSDKYLDLIKDDSLIESYILN